MGSSSTRGGHLIREVSILKFAGAHGEVLREHRNLSGWSREEAHMASPEISFDADIKPLFREKDRDSMRRAFDLWSYADVKTMLRPSPNAQRVAPCRATVRGPRSGSPCSNAG